MNKQLNSKNTKGLKKLLKKHSGRSSGGMVTVRSQGGRHKRYYREVDFKRNKFGVLGEVVALEYDPNRNIDIALVKYSDGEYRYILAPKGIKAGDKITSGDKVEAKTGNAMRLRNITVGTLIHNVELMPGKGGQLGRSAGMALQLLAKEGDFAHLKLPSGEVRMIPLESLATIGTLGNEDIRQEVLGKAGRSRHMGIKPNVRGVAQDPDSHPHGGGEGRSGIGRKKPMTKYGRPAVGKTRNKKKQSSRYIVKRRK
ncbi:MAG: 50S ribosomal protein L2 [uncultured bacterium]|uniref:Large ribosomal subunit protein uL2 n=1 Tax=Candidatus Daviesbacteria bacterium GW2011_GWC2_40_12 TaxID=1618431 RepID=A0A0G0QP00_9BACT|nr:MAG: 50S ribosomal protein L2 [uncultured bacterium]KKQ85399.1 MAG: 50S ribosomal protein L2 [Candidatus Daviesbacteria bacterium GW2011_GWF2_38_7]KKR17059.1 MAG: 50S ribosomal protein L2 [Candidatus Daviesbacteria bacterium GW2011_GWA2_39_33]KKR24265.1 MAG: 50S ribosomal protein L2 [Candidatus Daviesbacteria bacterium GW2011_GWB1_39_5]KKR42124.1 MAG: 50S ribosomal protein L2 [Candidatus Daviesbacteria bacterium GW2011_GWC2_40_12]HCE30482.1 50S ribosomal protein L2 [Candidatus Daviesbacteri